MSTVRGLQNAVGGAGVEARRCSQLRHAELKAGLFHVLAGAKASYRDVRCGAN